jgi:predicted regulator of Ras-like GTPase activity (Roadblock/LC7/MglB family)
MLSRRRERMGVPGNYRAASEWVNPRWLLDFASAEPYVGRLMATIRDVVEALSRRTGVDAVVVVGRDGLPIDSRTANGVDGESVAALLPSVIKGMTELGGAAGRGDFGTAVLEFGRGLAVVAVLHADALLIVLVRPETNVGALLFDLRRHRTAIAGLL